MTDSVREQVRPAAPVARRPGRAGRFVAWATALVLAVGGVVIWATPVLGLRTVEVVAAPGHTVTPQIVGGVRAAVAVPDGTPLARLDIQAVTRRVQAVGEVASATVARHWPHGLTVTVTPRVAVATTQANGRWWAVDATGLPFEQLAARPADLVPLQLASPGPGDRATMAALTVLTALSPELRKQVSGISAATAYDVTLFLAGGRTVIWGSADGAAAKNAVIPAMLRQPGKVFDVSDPTLVTVGAR